MWATRRKFRSMRMLRACVSPKAQRCRYSRSSPAVRGLGKDPPPERRRENSRVLANSSNAADSIESPPPSYLCGMGKSSFPFFMERVQKTFALKNGYGILLEQRRSRRWSGVSICCTAAMARCIRAAPIVWSSGCWRTPKGGEPSTPAAAVR